MSTSRNIKLSAVAELLVAAGFWGFGFIATAWALEIINAFETTFLRFAIASVCGLPFLLIGGARREWRKYVRLSALPGLLLASTLLLQTWGLQFTTATKSGFITTLYVVFVPILEASVSRLRLPLAIWLCVLTALIGTALIVDLGVTSLNFGDILTFGCALTATLQIYWMGRVSSKIHRPFVFNIYQCFWSVLFTAPFVTWVHFAGRLAEVSRWPNHAVGGVLSLAFGSTILAFFLQVRAQARISATVSSLMFLLESPFAMIFAILLLGETLRPLEGLGAALIFASALLATAIESRADRTPAQAMRNNR